MGKQTTAVVPPFSRIVFGDVKLEMEKMTNEPNDTSSKPTSFLHERAGTEREAGIKLAGALNFA